MSYYNTTAIKDTDLIKAYEEKAKTQKDLVLDVFKSRSDREYTPFEVREFLIGAGCIHPNTPITSIRRAVTDLANEGLIERTGGKKLEAFGRMNFCWRLRR